MEQTVLAGSQGNERPEGGGFHHGTHETFADLGHLGVRNRVHGVTSGFRGRTVIRPDVDGTVVLNGQFSAGILLNLVNHLSFRADDLTNLVHRNIHGEDTRSGRSQFIRSVDSGVHHVQNL